MHRGLDGLNTLATLPDADVVLVAVVGTTGLAPALAALAAGKDLALASKEILVLAGKFVLTAGLGGMGGAQPLAATMNDAAILGIDVDESRIDKRLETGYCDRKTHSLDEALAWIRQATVKNAALSVGLVGNAAELLPELVRRGVTPDVLTDQTSAHDTLNGYVPAGLSLADAEALRASDPAEYVRRANASIVAHVDDWLDSHRSLLAAIRSKVLPEADVILMNPRHPEARHVSSLTTPPFSFAECLHRPPMLDVYRDMDRCVGFDVTKD